ncbi:LysR substrate-binding domain-containing protein [Vibrio viridaestus]|uniref:LysR family transcriptional regulator n=1 Tax=Vibrio viridaestus TaxID=2487322 RepID=A0A3N9TLC6_9VIBR|nr:LysR substrate-binding domain-containing protein [Vibrio viridaestus]RQW64405.1 LysR family transcriptional regulator [Vibrio viridaestus]
MANLQSESLNGVITFVTAARCASFTEASEILGISKSAVGKAIARLEARLDVKLFHRTTRKISLTADGEAYFLACSNALNEISSAESSLGSSSLNPSGRLRIDMPVAYGKRVILPILIDIAQDYPDLEYTVTFTDHLIDPIDEGVDLAIRLGDLGSTSGLVAKKIYSERWLICGSPTYFSQHDKPKNLGELSQHKCIVGYRRNQPLTWKVNQNGENSRISPPATYQLGDGDAIIQTTLSGLGLCQMPETILKPHIERGELISVLEEYCCDPVNVYAVWPQTAHLRPKVRHVVDVLVDLGHKGALRA